MKSSMTLLAALTLTSTLAYGCSGSDGTTPNCTDYPCFSEATDASPSDAPDAATDSSSQDANVAD